MAKKVILTLAGITVVVSAGAYYLFSGDELSSIPEIPGQKKEIKTAVPSFPQNKPESKPIAEQTAVNVQSAPASVLVTIKDFNYSPASITVKRGTKITWKNLDNASHSVVSLGSNLIDSPTLTNGQSWSITINKLGTIEYNCGFHGMMRGKIIVTE